MSYQVCFTPAYKDMLKTLRKNGGEAKNASSKAQIALSEAQLEGEIRVVQRTFHGEDRLPNIEKYRLTDSYRLIVQLIDGVNKVRVFLFLGIHDDAEAWLNSNRGYKYVRNGSDSMVIPVLVTEPDSREIRNFDLESSEEEMSKPLLCCLNDSEIQTIINDSVIIDYLKKISSNDWEDRGYTIIGELEKMIPNNNQWETIYNLLDIAHENKFDKLQQMRLIIAMYQEKAKIVNGEELAIVLREPINAENFIEYETEMGDFWNEHPDADWDDWMLFLNPKQKEWAKKELNGPARLCGVSGSGKTCVMLHRARFLARKYQMKPIAILTLTVSMKNLLDSLLNRLCGAERSFIETYTIESFIKNILVEKSHPQGLRWISKIVRIDDSSCRVFVNNAVLSIFGSAEFQRVPWNNLSENEKYRFVIDEFTYVRTRLTYETYNEYCTSDFKRIGRGIALPIELRRVVLSALRKFEENLEDKHWVDHDSMTQMALKFQDSNSYKKYKALLIDEVQDLAQNDLRVLSLMENTGGIPLKDAPNGMFLVGDGAQTIYKNGFSLKKLGINILGRSFAFKKNYRNTKEILETAYALIKNFDCSNLDEDEVTKPISPELARQSGAKVKLVKAYNQNKECKYVVDQIKFLTDNGELPGNICIIGLTKNYRRAISNELDQVGFKSCEIKDNVQVGNNIIKISTIESAKGHEFSTVYIIGLAKPIGQELSIEEMTLEASRLYVAMTRACNNLILTYSATNGHAASPLLTYIEDFCQKEEIR